MGEAHRWKDVRANLSAQRDVWTSLPEQVNHTEEAGSDSGVTAVLWSVLRKQLCFSGKILKSLQNWYNRNVFQGRSGRGRRQQPSAEPANTSTQQLTVVPCLGGPLNLYITHANKRMTLYTCSKLVTTYSWCTQLFRTFCFTTKGCSFLTSKTWRDE